MQISSKEKQIFEELFSVAQTSYDPEGVVAAALVDSKSSILVIKPSADDAIRHAEDLVIEEAKKQGIILTREHTIYTTLEPCSQRHKEKNMQDCTTLIIKSGVGKVVIGARDPEWSLDTKERFEKTGIEYILVDDKEIEKKCIDIFNSTIKVNLDKMKLPRS
jgi:pyrimidine deaminase RibD-like protein